MNVLVIGSGGREHTLVWALKKSTQVDTVHCAPGNAGIEHIAECVSIPVNDFKRLAEYVQNNTIELTIVGPEDPLAGGIVDYFNDRGLAIFGPDARGAQIESSKWFCKQIMLQYGIPTAAAQKFSDIDTALTYIAQTQFPIVIKADGLAAGKGVTIATSYSEAEAAVHECMSDGKFGTAGTEVLIEDFLDGEEASVLAFVDGKHIIPMVSAQDHKSIGEHDTGPNTGGMGAYSPAPVVTPDIEKIIHTDILQRMVDALSQEGITYKGILYAGLMITADGPKVIEFNCRFGDPETQVVLSRLKTDILIPIQASINGTLNTVSLEWEDSPSVCVIMASGGYPDSYEKGKIITGLDTIDQDAEHIIFHAGTASNDGKIVTSGGRVLGITARAADLPTALNEVYTMINAISFDGAYFRKDIAYKALQRESHV